MQVSAREECVAIDASDKPWLQPYALADDANVVDRPRLEAALAKVRAQVSDPSAGVFGPDSVMWKVYGEQATGVAALRAILLQTAHPFVSHAVQQKSAYRTDPQGRHERTVRAVNRWIFGDLAQAFAAARTVWGVHTRVVGEIANRVGPYDRGDRYAANEQHAQFWVHATGVDSALRLYEHIHGPLGANDLARYHEESKRFALLFGIDERLFPPTWADFRAYMDMMFESDVLTPDQASLDIAKYLFTPPVKQAAPAFAWLKIMTAGLLPSRLRHGYELSWGRFEHRAYEASLKTLRATVPRLPPELRFSFAYRRALHRVRHSQPRLFERRVNRAILDFERASARTLKRSA